MVDESNWGLQEVFLLLFGSNEMFPKSVLCKNEAFHAESIETFKWPETDIILEKR